jgi:DNA-binding NarL/FixJ family response regulator
MTTSPLPRVLVADDHRLLLDAFVHLVQTVATVVGTATNGEELLALVAQHRPDLVVTDLSMPGISGLETIRRIRAMQHPPEVIVLTAHSDAALVKAAMDAGARGFVVKSSAADDLRAAIRVVNAGGSYRSAIVDLPQEPTPAPGDPLELLTDREREVLALVASGMTAREIGQRLGITERTVAFHKDRMKERLGVDSTVELVNMLVRSEYRGL